MILGAMDIPELSNFIPLILILASIAYLGVFVDYARRSGIIISSRLRLIVSAVLCMVLSIVSIVSVIYMATGSNILIDPRTTLSNFIYLGIERAIGVIAGIFLTFILLGSSFIYIVNRNEVGYTKTLLFITKLSIWPLIDVFGHLFSL